LLIQCIGNRLMGDDAAGPLVADRLRELPLPSDVQVREYWGEGSELLQDWDEASQVILVDGALSGADTGTLHRINLIEETVPAGLCFRGSHQFGVAEAVETARVLGRLPRDIRLFAIEGLNFSFGAEPTSAVTVAVQELAEEIVILTRAPDTDYARPPRA